MINECILSEEAVHAASTAIAQNEQWIAYNTIPYLIEKGDIVFFKLPEEAHEWCANNISECDNFTVIHAESLQDLMKQLGHDQELPDTKKQANKVQNTFPVKKISLMQGTNNKELNLPMKSKYKNRNKRFPRY